MLNPPSGYLLQAPGRGNPIADGPATALDRAVSLLRNHPRVAMRHFVLWLKSVRRRLFQRRSEEGVELRREIIRSYKAGDYRAAAEVARRLLDVQKRVLGEGHPDYATGLSNLSMLLRKQGDVAGAADLIEKVVAIRREALGLDDPETVRAESLLEALTVGAENLDLPRPPIEASATPLDLEPTTEPTLPVPERPAILDLIVSELAEEVTAVSTVSSEVSEPAGKSTSAQVVSLVVSELAEEALTVSAVSPRPRALAILDRVLALEFLGNGAFEEWNDCKTAARSLREAIVAGGSEDEADRLEQGDHRFAVLLSFIESFGHLADAEWASAYRLMSETLGVRLARAISRGQVRPAAPGNPANPDRDPLVPVPGNPA